MNSSADMMILGEGIAYTTDSNITGLNNNVIVCGSSGCGKTLSVIEPRLINTYNPSLVVTVTKRRIVDKDTDVFTERGYNVLDLNFSDPVHSSAAYDPLAYIKSAESCADISFLAQSIVKANHRHQSNADPYWDEAATSLLSALIAYVLIIEDKPSFADVLKLNDTLNIIESGSRIETTLDSKFELLAKLDPHSFAVSCWNSFKVLPVKTASCVYGTLNTTLDNVFSADIRRMIARKKKIDFEKLASEKTILFVTSSTVNPAINTLVNMFYSQMFKQLFEFSDKIPSGKLPLPVSILCDDFATGSQILNFPEYISIMREKQISVCLLLQSESQLEHMYGYDSSITIQNNCDTDLYLGGMDLRTCRNVSQRLNSPLDEILYMPLGQEIIFRRGSRPIITQRYNILENETFKEITRKYEKEIRRLEEKERK